MPTVSLNATPASGGPSTVLPATSVAGVALDSTNIYLITPHGEGAYALSKMPLAGGTQTVLAVGYGFIGGIAVGNASVYWTQGFATPPSSSLGAVVTVPVAGGTPTTIATFVDINQRAICIDCNNIAVDSANVYWVTHEVGNSPGTVMKAPLDGGPPVTIATDNDPRSVTVDDTSVYWVDGDGNVMKSTPK